MGYLLYMKYSDSHTYALRFIVEFLRFDKVPEQKLDNHENNLRNINIQNHISHLIE